MKGKNLNFSLDVATKDNFMERLEHEPQILYFSGHGVLNQLNKSWFRKDKGQGVLVVENGYLQNDYIYEEDIEEKLTILKTLGKEVPSLVILNSCHSESLG